MFEIKMTEKEIVDGLRSNYGKEFTAPDVRGFCACLLYTSPSPRDS